MRLAANRRLTVTVRGVFRSSESRQTLAKVGMIFQNRGARPTGECQRPPVSFYGSTRTLREGPRRIALTHVRADVNDLAGPVIESRRNGGEAASNACRRFNPE